MRAGFHCLLAHQFDLGVGVGVEAIDGYDDRRQNARVATCRHEVGAAALQQFKVLLGVGTRRAPSKLPAWTGHRHAHRILKRG